MNTLTKTKAPKFLMPRDEQAVGPQDEAEKRLYDLVMDGVNSGPSQRTSVDQLTAELRARIRAKR